MIPAPMVAQDGFCDEVCPIPEPMRSRYCFHAGTLSAPVADPVSSTAVEVGSSPPAGMSDSLFGEFKRPILRSDLQSLSLVQIPDRGSDNSNVLSEIADADVA